MTSAAPLDLPVGRTISKVGCVTLNTTVSGALWASFVSIVPSFCLARSSAGATPGMVPSQTSTVVVLAACGAACADPARHREATVRAAAASRGEKLIMSFTSWFVASLRPRRTLSIQNPEAPSVARYETAAASCDGVERGSPGGHEEGERNADSKGVSDEGASRV